MPDRNTTRTLAACGVVLVVALLARGPGVGDRSFWLDEAETLKAAAAPDIEGLWERVRYVEFGRSPTYYLLLRGWISLFGAGEAAVRWLSVICGALTAAAVCLWGSMLLAGRSGPASGPARASPAWGGLVAGLIVALHPFLIGASREARSYPLAHLLLVLAAILACRLAVRSGPFATSWSSWPTRIGFVVSAALAVSCHLIAAFFVLGLAAWLFRAAGRDRSALERLLVDLSILACLLLPVAWLTLMQNAHLAKVAPPPPDLTWRDLAHNGLLLAGGKPAGIVIALLFVILAVRFRRLPAVRTSLLILVPSLTALLLTEIFVQSVLQGRVRYLAWCLAPVAVVIGASLDRRRLPSAIATVVLMASLVVGAVLARDFEVEYSEDWRAVAAAIEAEVEDGDVVLCHAHYVSSALALYYDRDLAGPEFHRSSPDGRSRPDVEALRLGVPRNRKLFLVWSHAGELDRETLSRFEALFGPSTEIHSQYAIRVLRFD